MRNIILMGLSLIVLSSCGVIEVPITEASLAAWQNDDGITELMPEYNVQHIVGDSYSDVHAAFTALATKKNVRLGGGSFISVNGYKLNEKKHKNGYYYYARIPISEGVFIFNLSREPGSTLAHEFTLPEIGVLKVPTSYRPHETIYVPVKYDEPPHYVSDYYILSIFSGIRYSLDSIKKSPTSKYNFDRLPNVHNNNIVFKNIIKIPPNPGIYPAEIYRQQRIPLRAVSSASSSGWAVLTNTLPFTIEVQPPI